MAYDSSIISYTTKTNKVDLVDAAHINALQTEIVTIETILGTGLKGTSASLSARLNNALDSDGSVLSGTAFPSPALTSQMFYRTDEGRVYFYNGVSWALPSSALILTSSTTITASASTSSITIDSTKQYIVKIDVSLNSVAQVLSLQFNGDNGLHYRYAFRELKDDATTASGNSTSTTAINLGGVYDVTSADYRASYEFKIGVQGTSSGKYIHIQGNAWGNYSGGSCKFTDFFGAWSNGATATSFVISGTNWTGKVYLYEMTIS